MKWSLIEMRTCTSGATFPTLSTEYEWMQHSSVIYLQHFYFNVSVYACFYGDLYLRFIHRACLNCVKDLQGCLDFRRQKSLKYMGKKNLQLSQSPFLRRVHLNSFLVVSVWFKLTGMPVKCLRAAPPLVVQRGSGPIMKANLRPQAPGCLSMRMWGVVLGNSLSLSFCVCVVCEWASLPAHFKKKMEAWILLPASCHPQHQTNTKHNQCSCSLVCTISFHQVPHLEVFFHCSLVVASPCWSFTSGLFLLCWYKYVNMCTMENFGYVRSKSPIK